MSRRLSAGGSIDRLAATIGGVTLEDMRDLSLLIATVDQERALMAAIEQEFRRQEGHKHADKDQAHVRMMAAINVGYRLGLAMPRVLAGGAR